MTTVSDKSRFKSFRSAVRHQEKRRDAFFQRSQHLRTEALEKVRKIAREEALEDSTIEDSNETCTQQGSQQRRTSPHLLRRYSNLLMTHEWMIGTPVDFGPEWRVMARPEGTRCLLVASRGKTMAVRNSGHVMNVFPSALPNGSQKTKKPSHVFSMLDTVFHEPDQTFYVLDVLAWNGVQLCGAEVDCRMPWATGEFNLTRAPGEPYPGHKYRIRMCEMHVCTSQGLAAVYQGDVPYGREGLLLLHSRSPYIMGQAASSSCALRWKDRICSRWPVDTDKDGQVLEEQHVVLAYRSGKLLTGDSAEPIVLGRMPEAVVQQYKDKLRNGLLLRFKVGPGGFFLDDSGAISGADLHLVGVASRMRQADLYSRIVFQWQMRTDQINFDALQQQAEKNFVGDRVPEAMKE